ncbi:hypothetical protein Hte_010251 [Hypoxylon texense]
MSRRSYIAIAATILLTSTFVNTALAVGYADFGAFDDAALFPADHMNPGLGPRLFMNGMPPIPAARSSSKQKRQTADQCGPNQHGCLELGPAGAAQCCRNDQYCFLDATWQPRCCGLGTTCGSPCAEEGLFCNQTVVSTVTVATSSTVTLLAQTTQTPACCNRPCSSSFFLCQAAFGGQCCEYGAQCLSNGQCLFTSTPISTIVTPIPSGCTTSQISCSEGGGCCNLGSTCTSAVSGTMTSQACAANLTVVDSGGGLSEGAKVGIGVGIAVGAAVVIGALTWFVVRRRRDARSRRGGGGNTTTLAGSEPFIPHGHGPTSDVTSTTGVGRPPLHVSGLTYTYYGPDAVEGPYTDRADGGGAPGRSLSCAEPRPSTGFSDRVAVPSRPDRPGDIVRPVELDADANGGATRVELEEKGVGEISSTPIIEGEDDEHGPYELYGSPGTSPPPLNAEEEAEWRRAQNLSPISSPSPQPPADQQREKKDGQK